MDVRYLVLSLFFLVSCMPTATVSKGNLADTETTGGSTSGTDGGTGAPTNLSWNFNNQLTKTITINVSNLNNAYVVGTPVENYLSDSLNFSNTNYCLVSSYSIGGIAYELRSRIIPISYYDFTNKRTVRILRVDFQDVTNSMSFCNKTTRVQNSSGAYVPDSSTPPASLISYTPSDICETCTGVLSSTKVRVFKLDSGTNLLDEVPGNFMNTGSLSLQIDPNFATGGSAGTCSNNDCIARGYDCCLDNQCVNDGSIKPAAYTQYSSLLETVEEERITNPLAYLNYPQLYYICGTSVPTTTGGSGGGTTGSTTGGSTGGYDEAFEKLKTDYKCIEHIKSQSTLTPFQDELLTKTYMAATDCLTSSADSAQPFYYKNVIMRMYETCGCNRTDFTDAITNCPKYDYTVVTEDAVGEPLRIDCYTPPTDVPEVPTQQSVTFSSRSAPHRFFDVNGVERDPSAGIEQEGAKFEYLDEGMVLPIQQNFSMNAILGQMSVTLDKALPAKTVNVELDQVYLISTTQGYYTPCPTCAKDSWLNSFTAFPTTSSGVGLQAVGHSTQRDSFSTNTSSGNYEDTIFGRACWLPPTMLPFSHSAKTSAQEQRMNRLQTQAALFVNGYQRDWYGFNKGALIGSFDGVSWFAIGKGRIVRSSTKKLFLAINAPFADVASPTMHVVSVQAYDGITQAADVDYDPQYHQYHPYQNEAGNCQKYHMCETDTDCVTQLGWEYACADVKDLKTNWPEFDGDANEKAVTAKVLTIDQILAQKRFPSSSTKRCVYRGAGSLCHTNVASLPATDLNKKKLLTCAPNFFCANAASGGVHNTKIARYAASLEEIPVARNHFYGKDANIMGRPHDYIGTGSLIANVRSTLSESMSQYEPSMSTNTGLCQPGKALPSATNPTLANPFNQHLSADPARRTDYISQIGSCNSTLFNSNRHTSCPVLGADGNYEIFASASIPTGFAGRATNQNACGLESLLPTASLSSSADALLSSSPFRAVEAKTLNSQIILDPTLVRDACFRRAGAACHTDLDCSPNTKHADQAELFGTNFFGNLAEKTYWTEYLVCGQAEDKPLPSNSDAFKNYDMTKNLCCREIGKDLTTYTSDLPTSTQAGNYDPNTVGLKMSLPPGSAPNDPQRYSRLATVDSIGTDEKPILTAYQERLPGGTLDENSQGAHVMTPNQWKSLGEANSESCCGGGWIRKFSDGSNDWTRRDRLALDVTNFACINSRTPLITHPEDVAGSYNSIADVTAKVSLDYGDYCKDATNTNGACAQFSIADTAQDVPPDTTDPNAPYSAITINTILPDYDPLSNRDYYFKPRSGDGNTAVIVDYNNASGRRNIVIRLPSYVPRSFDSAYAGIGNGAKLPGAMKIKMVTANIADGNRECVKDSSFDPSSPTTSAGAAGDTCYFSYNSTTRVLKVGATDDVAAVGADFEKKQVGISFQVSNPAAGLTRAKPGTNAFYLKRLGRLELTGVPQITYEELRCNDNHNRIVQGIFSPQVKYHLDGTNPNNSFNDIDFIFKHTYDLNPLNSDTTDTRTAFFTNQFGLQIEPIFSANDFKCCTPLGKSNTDASKCCSGFGVPNDAGGTQFTCALPAGTDLMVYFNRYISNEGRGDEQPGGGLTDADFDAVTGEPYIQATTNDKIKALGKAYCVNNTVRQGGAFGKFEPEPQGSETNLSDRIYNIVDSTNDNGVLSNAGETVNTGYTAFSEGFRWNHHLYCND